MRLKSSYGGTLLRTGSKGDAVKKTQQALASRAYPCKATGLFDGETRRCVVQFQTDSKLKPDGLVGPLTWGKLFGELPPEQPSEEAIAALRSIKRRSNVYRKPTEQDKAGRGILPTGKRDDRSERIYPAWVLGPRRQVDSLVRQMYALLPNPNTAFVITDRLVQYPQEYLPYILESKDVILIGSLVGLGNSPTIPAWRLQRQTRELGYLEQSIQLAQALKRPIKSIIVAMGDSPNPAKANIRAQLQSRLNSLLDKYRLSTLKRPLTWGADEAVLMAFAQTLPPAKVLVRISNPDCRHHYEASETSREIVPQKLGVMGLSKVNDGWDFDDEFAQNSAEWDFEVAILTRRPGGSINRFQADDREQARFDGAFLSRYQSYSPERRRKLAIIDGRLFNGAWDARAALPHCDLLAFGSWGTFGNAVGSTLAVAKILAHVDNTLAQKQLYLEAVAHDVFANGYAEAQSGELKTRVDRAGIGFNHYRYDTAQRTAQVFKILNSLVNERMQAHFAGTDCLDGRRFRFTPQLWRTFESEVHLVPSLAEEVARAGVFRKDLDANAFHPLLA
ncbi:MAG: DUF4127 family protein [Elainellaceae cyanobacterium]